MVDIERKGLTLDDWTKGISVDEYAWWSYFYADWIQSWYNTKWFKLWPRTSDYVLNERKDWYVTGLIPNSSSSDMIATTYDWRIEWTYFNNGSTEWAYFAIFDDWALSTNYLWALKYWDSIIGIRWDVIDLIKYRQTYTPNAEIITEPDFDNWWAGWTLWTGWTIWDDWAEHEVWQTWELEANLTSTLTSSDVVRVAIHVKNCTKWYVTAYLWALNVDWGQTEAKKNWRFTFSIQWDSSKTNIRIVPSSTFDWTIATVDVHIYDMSKIENKKADITHWPLSDKHPAIIWSWGLYIWCWSYVDIISLTDWQTTSKHLVDDDYTIVSITQQAGNLILWATDWFNSKQYYWNWVDRIASEIIEWKWLIIKWVVWTETLSYVLTTAWKTEWTITTYEYRLYAVSWYQRSLLANKSFTSHWVDYDSKYYHKEKRFEFNDVKSSDNMIIFLDSLYLPWCDWIYKYGSEIPWVKSTFTRPIRYKVWATNIVLWQRWNDFFFSQTVDWVNYISELRRIRYVSKWYMVTNSIYRDKLSTRKTIEKLKIWYKNLASEDWGINIYVIVNDDYFWRFEVTWVTDRPKIWDIYTVAHQVKAEVINVDKTNKIITFRTAENKGWYDWEAEDTLSKVSWDWDSSIAVVWFDNMCLVKEIKSDEQWYWSDLVFWKDFVDTYMPYWYKMQLVVELYNIDIRQTPEIYEISIASDISDSII